MIIDFDIEELVDIAKCGFKFIGDIFVVALYFTLIIFGFVLMLYFLGSLILLLFEWIKSKGGKLVDDVDED